MLTNLRFSFRFGAFRRPEKTTFPCRRDVPAACAAPPDGAQAPRRPAERNKSADRKNGQPSRIFCQPFRISCQPAIGVARRGAIYDARCPWGHKVSVAFRTAASVFFPVIPGESVSHPGVTSGAPTFFVRAVVGCGSVPCECVGLPSALPVGAPFMTPGARGGTRCRSHFARRHPHFLQHSGWFRRSSGRHKWRPYVFCADGCGLWRRSVRMCRAASGAARRGAIYDARCRAGTRCRLHFARRPPRFFRSSRAKASVIRASQVAPLRFLCRRLWVAAAGHLADLRRLQSRQSI